MVTESKKNTDWLATVFYPLSVILMEAFWVSPWLNWVGTWPFFREARPVLNLVSVIILLSVSLVLTRLTAKRKLPMWGIQFIVIGVGVLALIIVTGLEYRDGYAFLSGAWFGYLGDTIADTLKNASTVIVALPVIIYLWWRGIMLGQSTTYFKDIYRSFIIGMVALILLIIIWQSGAMAMENAASPGSGLGFNVIAFFFFGLLSIAICHLYVMRSTMPREDAALTSVWRWVPLMLGIIGGLVLVGFLVASIFSPDMMSSLGSGLKTVGSWLGQLFEWILTPFIYLFQGIVWLFKWFLSLFQSDAPPDSQNMTAGGMPDFGDVDTTQLPGWVGVVVKWVVLAVIVGLVIFILGRTISKYRAKKAEEQVDEVSESLFSWKGLRDDLKEMLNSFRFRKKPPAAPASSFDPDVKGRLDIREIFRHLQWEGRRSGVTRHRHETASEYTRRLSRAVPDSVESIKVTRESLDGIKMMYESVRYGETVISEPRIDEANGFWQTIKGLLRKLRGE